MSQNRRGGGRLYVSTTYVATVATVASLARIIIILGEGAGSVRGGERERKTTVERTENGKRRLRV